jgi:2-dehydropantoate 2-reductase
MKICVFGAGAIGGLIAARLARIDCDVSVVARGPHLQAIRRNGLTLLAGADRQTCRIRATDNAAELGVQDVVIVAVKAAGLTQAAPAVASLIGPDTMVVPAMNGVPWWFFSRFGGSLEGTRLEAIDPGGIIAANIPEANVVGCVVYPTANIAEPGVVHHTGRNELYLGEPDGSISERTARLAGVLDRAGFACKVSPQIRHDVWLKLIGNASFNPVSALTCATLDRMLAEPAVCNLLKALMSEVIAVGHALGLPVDEDPQERLERGRVLGAVKFSMLQDLEQNRPFEYEALTGAVVFIAARLGIEVPKLRDVYGLIKVRAETVGR